MRDLVDTPASDMGPAHLETAAEGLARRHDATLTVTRGDALAQGYAGQVRDVVAQRVLGVSATVSVMKQEGWELALSSGAIVSGGRNDHGISQMSEQGQPGVPSGTPGARLINEPACR